MIEVRRRESEVSASEAEAALAALDGQPGVWMGCDVAAEGLYRKVSVACARAALRLCLDGDALRVTPLGDQGAGLLPRIAPLAEFVRGADGMMARMTSGVAAAGVLKRFLGLFHPQSAELGLYGAFSFDYYRLSDPAALPEDGRRRFVLYLPEQVIVADAAGARRIDFEFQVEPVRLDPAQARIAPASLDADADELPPGGHAARVAGGIERLRRGELYSLVLSQTFRRRTPAAPACAFAALRRRNPYPAMFFCNLGGGETLFGASPDLQLRADAQWVESAPVCGTLRRGADALEDADQAFALLASDKEGAAIALCADAAASDHAAVCEAGSVEVLSHRRAHFFSTIVHAIDHLRGRRRAGLDAVDLLLAHAAPATVTGLPKAAAVRAIEALEADWRGWYAGAVARLGTDGSVEAYTVLRAARVAAGIAEIRTGGNVLVDSDPQKEEEESRLKALTLFEVLGADERRRPDAASETRWRIVGPQGDDSFAPGLANALARAGALPAAATNGGAVTVLSGPPAGMSVPMEPVLAIGDGALWLLERAGAHSEPLARPEFARRLVVNASPEGFLASLGAFQAARYASRGIRTSALPAEWRESARSEDGWVLAAEHRSGRACALLFRPDSVLSLRGAAGTRALQAALSWLARGMFAAHPIGGNS